MDGTADTWGWGDAAGDRVETGEVWSIALDGFSGPLDLLLALARTHKIDLSKLSMLELAEQYLVYVAEARKLRLELAADYLVMAAWLAYLKSRLLLPQEKPAIDEPTAEQLAAKLAFRLMRLEAMRNAVAQLMTRKQLGIDVFGRGMPQGTRVVKERSWQASYNDLLKAYAVQRNRRAKHEPHVIAARKVWSIKDARRQLERLVGQSAGDWVQLDLFIHQYLPSPDLGRTAMASSFGATLEMAREGIIELHQAEPFSPIWVKRRDSDSDWQRLR